MVFVPFSAIYDTVTGKLFGLGSVIDGDTVADGDALLVSRGLTRLEIPAGDLRPDGMGVRRDRQWNEGTRSFDAIVLPRLITSRDFFKRFTPAEREEIRDRSKNGTPQEQRRLSAFMDEVQILGEFDLNNPLLSTVLDQMETAGIIAPGRKAEILA
jgi:hypothetical protein